MLTKLFLPPGIEISISVKREIHSNIHRGEYKKTVISVY